jgi:hypothetical protein
VITTTSNGGTEETGQRGVVRFSQIGEMTGYELLGVGMVRKAEGALEYNGVVVEDRAPPGSTGETIRDEVICSAGEIGEGNKGREGFAKRVESCGE